MLRSDATRLGNSNPRQRIRIISIPCSGNFDWPLPMSSLAREAGKSNNGTALARRHFDDEIFLDVLNSRINIGARGQARYLRRGWLRAGALEVVRNRRWILRQR